MISLIIPTYNNSETLPLLVREIFEVGGRHQLEIETIVIDDNSSDGTGELAFHLKRYFPLLRTYHRAEKLGHTSAILQGIDQAQGKIVGVMDANYTHSPAMIPELVRPIISGFVDISIASRYVEHRPIHNSHLMRNLSNQIALLSAKPLTNVKDPLSNYFFTLKQLFYTFPVNEHSPKLLLDLLTKSNYRSAQEIPYDFIHPQGRKTVKWEHGTGYFTQLFRLYRHRFFTRSENESKK